MKITDDTLKVNGKWSIKRMSAFVSFHTALLYEFLLPILAIPTKEYVFITLITYSATAIGMTLAGKKLGEIKTKQEDETI